MRLQQTTNFNLSHNTDVAKICESAMILLVNGASSKTKQGINSEFIDQKKKKKKTLNLKPSRGSYNFTILLVERNTNTCLTSAASPCTAVY